MPGFIDLIEGLGAPRQSVLIGISQGAIMSLHAVVAGLPVAGVIELSCRLAEAVGHQKRQRGDVRRGKLKFV